MVRPASGLRAPTSSRARWPASAVRRPTSFARPGPDVPAVSETARARGQGSPARCPGRGKDRHRAGGSPSRTGRRISRAPRARGPRPSRRPRPGPARSTRRVPAESRRKRCPRKFRRSPAGALTCRRRSRRGSRRSRPARPKAIRRSATDAGRRRRKDPSPQASSSPR